MPSGGLVRTTSLSGASASMAATRLDLTAAGSSTAMKTRQRSGPWLTAPGSALPAKGDGAEEFEHEFERGQAGDMSQVERWRYLVYIQAGQFHPAQTVEKVEQLSRGQATRGGDAGPRGYRWIERVDVKRNMQCVGAGALLHDLAKALGLEPCRFGARDQRDPGFADELDFLPVKVTTPQQDHLPRVDLGHLQAPAQGAAVRPAGVSRDVVQVGMGIDVEDGEAAVVTPLLRDQGGCHRGVVASEDDRDCPRGRALDACRQGLDIRAHVTRNQGQVSPVLHRQLLEPFRALGDGRKDGRKPP